jgi:hypothetical protein
MTSGSGFVEHFRLDARGRLMETQYQLVSGGNFVASRRPEQLNSRAEAKVMGKDDHVSDRPYFVQGRQLVPQTTRRSCRHD